MVRAHGGNREPSMHNRYMGAIMHHSIVNPDPIQAFSDYFKIGRAKSPRTAAEYSRDLRRFQRFIEPVPITEATTEQIEAWRDALLMEGRNQPQSVRRKLAAVSSFCKWRTKKKMRKDNPFDGVEMPDVPKRLPKHVTNADVEKILSVTLNHRKCSGFQQLRDRAMLEILYGSGLRRAEVCGLDLADIDTDERTVRVRNGKGGKERFSFLSEPALKAIADYLAVRPESKSEALFLTIRRQRITPRQLWCVFKKHREAARAAGLTKHITPHGFRHAYATGLYQGGADLQVIQQLLGHSNISTTTIYTYVSLDRKRAAYESAHPRAKAS
jgi:site-specific recombinase XerD